MFKCTSFSKGAVCIHHEFILTELPPNRKAGLKENPEIPTGDIVVSFH